MSTLTSAPKLRVARPVTDISRAEQQYLALGLSTLYKFEGHSGFDGVMLGVPKAAWHLELVKCEVKPTPTEEDLLVFYFPDSEEWKARCEAAEKGGWIRVESANPYWEDKGKTYADGDGYRVVIQRYDWTF